MKRKGRDGRDDERTKKGREKPLFVGGRPYNPYVLADPIERFWPVRIPKRFCRRIDVLEKD